MTTEKVLEGEIKGAMEGDSRRTNQVRASIILRASHPINKGVSGVEIYIILEAVWFPWGETCIIHLVYTFEQLALNIQ